MNLKKQPEELALVLKPRAQNRASRRVAVVRGGWEMHLKWWVSSCTLYFKRCLTKLKLIENEDPEILKIKISSLLAEQM